MTDARLANELAGQTIKEVFQRAEEISRLHSCLTSPRGDYFRLRILQAMEASVGDANIETAQAESGVQEHLRHLNKLLKAGLISERESDTGSKYTRTELGETAVNAVDRRQLFLPPDDNYFCLFSSC